MSNSPSFAEKDQKVEIQYFEDAPSRNESQLSQADPAVVKRILRKADLRILPVMSLLYLLSFLDRTAIGNANIAGLSTDLKLTGQEYNTVVTVFFVLYGLLEVPSNLMLKRLGAKIWIPSIMLGWGIIMTLTCLVKNFTGLLVARLMLGALEAGLFPGVTYYLTTWYKRSECQFRIGFFFSAATMAGAFGGLFAFALTKLDGKAGLKGWAYIFMVEGLLTVIAAICAYFWITDRPHSAKWLTQEEADILTHRLAHDGVSIPMNNDFDWKFVRSGLIDWKVWLCFVIYVCSLTAVYSVALNLPAITVGLGYSGTQAQLITVPVYVFASIMVIVLALFGDKYHLRSPCIIFGLTTSLIGYTILYVSYTPGVRYFGAFLAAAGAYSSFPAVVCLLTNNVGGATKRSTEIGILVGIGGMCGMISSNVFRKKDAPHYGFGIMVNIGLCSLGIVTTVLMALALKASNKRKQALIDSGKAATFTDQELADMGDESPFFMYTI